MAIAKYCFGGGESLYHHAIDSGWGEVKVYLREGIKCQDALRLLGPNQGAGIQVTAYKYGDWIPWEGGEPPLPSHVKVDVKVEGEVRIPNTCSKWCWEHTEGWPNITHYRLSVEGSTCNRQTGRTTEQIKGAPKGAFYIVPNSRCLAYVRKMLYDFRREDLKPVAPAWLNSVFLSHSRITDVIVDHATELTSRQEENLSRFTGHEVCAVLEDTSVCTKTEDASDELWKESRELGKHDDHIEPLTISCDLLIKPKADQAEVKGTFSVDNTEKESKVDIKDRYSLGKAEGQELTNLARLIGVKRAFGESDESLRSCLKEVNYGVDNSTEKSKLSTQSKLNEDLKMTNTIKRTTVTASLFDNDSGIDVTESLVFSTELVVQNGDTQVALQEVIFSDEQLAESIKAHNKKRTNTINLDLLERTGREVMLREVKLSELTWEIK